VVTGIGVACAAGLGRKAFWESLRQHRGGIRRLTQFDPSGLPCQIAGEVQDFDAKNYIDKKERKSLKVMARSIQLAVAGAQLALDDAQVDKAKLDPTRFGVEFGAGLIASELEELGPPAQVSFAGEVGHIDLEKWGEQGLTQLTPLWMLKYLPNMLACHVSILHNAQGPSNTITESDVASLLALGEAYRIISRGQADIFLAGGGDSKLNPLSLTRQCLFLPLSRRNAEPDKACRPFDRRRDGMVLGEGAGVFVLEELEHAHRRGARIYASVQGFGAAFDPHKTGAGIARAIHAACRDADLPLHCIDHVNAHGTGAVGLDAWEARGIAEAFRGSFREDVPVFAAKSYFGNLGAGSSAVELAASLLALDYWTLPPTLNYEEPDPACPVNVVAEQDRTTGRPYVLKVGFTELGQCAAIICRAWDNPAPVE
jgi:3-oxoacyl-[acyl-carrier-protein] synthase II